MTIAHTKPTGSMQMISIMVMAVCCAAGLWYGLKIRIGIEREEIFSCGPRESRHTIYNDLVIEGMGWHRKCTIYKRVN